MTALSLIFLFGTSYYHS